MLEGVEKAVGVWHAVRVVQAVGVFNTCGMQYRRYSHCCADFGPQVSRALQYMYCSADVT